MGMGFKLIVILLLVLFVITFSGLTPGIVGVDSISGHKLLEVERKLDRLNKHAVKSIHVWLHIQFFVILHIYSLVCHLHFHLLGTMMKSTCQKLSSMDVFI